MYRAICQRPLAEPAGIAVLPIRFDLSIGGYFGTSYAVKLCLNGLWYSRYRHFDFSEPAASGPQILPVPAPAMWRRFRAELDALNAWTWRRYYPNVVRVRDGYGFHFQIEYADRQLISSGDQCFPGAEGEPVPIVDRIPGDPFDHFCAAVSRLIGQPFR